jgi:hypothetical protein
MYTSKKKYMSDDWQTPFHLDVTSLAQFTTCAVINTPLAFLWMNNLEAHFPTYAAEQGTHAKKSDEKGADSAKPRKISVKNTIAKIVLDQTVGAAWVTILFLTTMGILRGQDLGGVMNTIQNVSFYHFFVIVLYIFFYIWVNARDFFLELVSKLPCLSNYSRIFSDIPALSPGLLVYHDRRSEALALGFDPVLHRRPGRAAAAGGRALWLCLGYLSQSNVDVMRSRSRCVSPKEFKGRETCESKQTAEDGTVSTKQYTFILLTVRRS